MTDASPRMIRCPMHDWAQVAPSREAALALLSRHLNESHSTAHGGPPPWLIERCDARLADLGVEYVAPDGRWVP